MASAEAWLAQWRPVEGVRRAVRGEVAGAVGLPRPPAWRTRRLVPARSGAEAGWTAPGARAEAGVAGAVGLSSLPAWRMRRLGPAGSKEEAGWRAPPRRPGRGVARWDAGVADAATRAGWDRHGGGVVGRV